MRGRFFSFEIWRYFITPHGVSLDKPAYLILPALTSWSKLYKTSSTVVQSLSLASYSKSKIPNFGTFLLKDFFSEAYRKDNGDLISTKEIKSKLVEIIGSEDKENPLTDEKLCGLLGENEYHIARRTVSKYRDELNIPTAKKRRTL